MERRLFPQLLTFGRHSRTLADTIHVGDTFEAYKLKENIDTLVLGGGQAGLSVSWHLKKAGRDHLVLDRGRIGDTWRRRWDSFCLVTPNCYCQFPEFPYDGDNPEGFMLRDEIVGYVERFARSFDPPYRAGVDVQRVEPSSTGRGFSVETSQGDYESRNVVVAVGSHQYPNFPAWSEAIDEDIVQLHTQDYCNPAQLPDGAVLVVGSAQSGCQVVEESTGCGP